MSFNHFVQAIIDGDIDAAAQALKVHPTFVTRQHSTEFFDKHIAHQVYRGDTALHLAAAAFQPSSVELLLRHGASHAAKNRRRAEPLHYAADTNRWRPSAQAATIEALLSAGANPNAADANGATPLHRAVRTRSAVAVRVLLAGGANVHATNRNGSTPYALAIRDTGRGGAGSAHARAQQRDILTLVRAAGAEL
jgi:hypothetical protein